MRYTTSPMRGIFAVSLLSLSVRNAVQAQALANQEIEEVVVRAHPLSAEGLAQPIGRRLIGRVADCHSMQVTTQSPQS